MPLKQELIAQMQRRFVNIEENHTLAKSTLLDPRLKKVVFQNRGEAQGLQSLVQELNQTTASHAQGLGDDDNESGSRCL